MSPGVRENRSGGSRRPRVDRPAAPPRPAGAGRQAAASSILAIAAALGGCGSLTPDHRRPDAPVAAAFSTDPGIAGTTPAGARAASDIDWPEFFTDARLRRLIEIALANNRDLRIAVLNIEQARAQFQVRRADLLPSVGVGASWTRQPGATGNQTSTYVVGASVTGYELDLFGRVRALSDAALATYLGTEEARKAVQISLIANVATAHLALLADDELLAVTRQTLGTREQSLRLTRLRFDNGVVSELDVRQAESLLESARATLAQLLRQRANDENALVLLLGQPLGQPLSPLPSALSSTARPLAGPASQPSAVASDWASASAIAVPAATPAQAASAALPPALPLSAQQLRADLPADVPSELLARRPDVRQAEQTLIAANANIGAARAAFFPKISLTGSAGLASTHLNDLFQGGSFAWTLAPSVTLPIFDAGRNRASLEVATANRDIAIAQYERAIQVAFREVADALAGRATLGEQLRAQQAQADAEARRFQLADLRYRNGVASFLDVLDAQRALFVAQQATVQARAAQVQNLVTLYQVLGGGWK